MHDHVLDLMDSAHPEAARLERPVFNDEDAIDTRDNPPIVDLAMPGDILRGVESPGP